MKPVLAWGLALAVLAACPVRAALLPNGVSVMRADELQEKCITAVVLVGSTKRPSTEDERMHAEACASYFSALNETLMALRDGGVNPMGICYPATPLPAIFSIKTFIAFVDSHDEAKTAFAMPVALAAMAEALPCYPGPKPK